MISCVGLFAPYLPTMTRTPPPVDRTEQRDFAATSLRRQPLRSRLRSSPEAEAARLIGKIAFASDRDGNWEI